MADALESVTAERDALREAIRNGPHQPWCGDWTEGEVDDTGCNCWVAAALAGKPCIRIGAKEQDMPHDSTDTAIQTLIAIATNDSVDASLRVRAAEVLLAHSA